MGLCLQALVCVPKVESHEKAFRHTAFYICYHVVSYSMNISECSAVKRRSSGRPFVEGTQAEKTISHNISIRQIYGYSFAEERPCVACCTFFFSASVMSCLLWSPFSCFVWWWPLFTVRAIVRHRAFFFYSAPCSVYTPWAEKCTLGQGGWTQCATTKKPYWNLLGVHSRLN